MENKILELIKSYTNNLQKKNQTELSLANEQLSLSQDILKLFVMPDISISVCQYCGNTKSVKKDIESGMYLCLTCSRCRQTGL